MLEKLIQDDITAAKTPVLLLAFAGEKCLCTYDYVLFTNGRVCEDIFKLFYSLSVLKKNVHFDD